MLCEITQDKVIQMITRTYSELIMLPTFEERFEYLNLCGKVGAETFGSKRYLNQILYKTDRWLSIRDKVIIRDNGCDLGVYGREILFRLTVHHMNPITIEDVLNESSKVFNLEYLITTADMTHKAIHYGNEDLLIHDPIIRTQNDTCLWRH